MLTLSAWIHLFPSPPYPPISAVKTYFAGGFSVFFKKNTLYA